LRRQESFKVKWFLSKTNLTCCFGGQEDSSKIARFLNNSTPDSLALGGQMHQATEITRHQEGNKTRAKQPGRTRYTDLRTEFPQKQRSTSGHWWGL